MLSIFSPLRIMFAVGLPYIAFILLTYVPSSWKTDGETVETVRDFILGGSKITADGDSNHEIIRSLLLERNVMTNLKSRDITLATKVHLVKALVFPVVMYGWEKAMATHSSTLAWRIPGTGEPGGLQSMGSQRVRHDCGTSLHFTSPHKA